MGRIWRRRSGAVPARGDGGQVGLALGLVVAAAAVAMLVVLGELARTIHDRTRARTAADAAALAAAGGGCPVAGEVAVANGGTVEDCSFIGVAAEVTVRVGVARARSRAVPGAAPASSTTGRDLSSPGRSRAR